MLTYRNVTKDAREASGAIFPSRRFMIQAVAAYYGVKWVYPVHFEPGEVAAVAAAEHHLSKLAEVAPHAVVYIKVRIKSVVKKEI